MAPSTSTRGFTLIELAVVIALVGLAVATAASLAIPIMESSKRIQTEEKMRVISRAIAEYVAVSASVPCPAEPNLSTTNPPYGYPRGTGANGANMPMGGCGGAVADARGIVPFRALNLPEDMARDGWGNYFIYAVSRNYTRHFLNDFQNQASHRAVHYHAQCRTREWYKKIGPITFPLTSDLAHIVSPKAYFCCGYGIPNVASPLTFGPATDILINDINNTRISPQRSAYDSAPPAPQRLVINAADSTTNPVVQPYQNLDPNSFVPKGETPTTVVYALISLGKNGRGRYNVATGVRVDDPPNPSAEWTNVNPASLAIIDAPVNDDPANFFDDIVHWETQDMIMAQLGESCATP